MFETIGSDNDRGGVCVSRGVSALEEMPRETLEGMAKALTFNVETRHNRAGRQHSFCVCIPGRRSRKHPSIGVYTI